MTKETQEASAVALASSTDEEIRLFLPASYSGAYVIADWPDVVLVRVAAAIERELSARKDQP